MCTDITLLSASNSLGIYVPAKLLQQQLRDSGQSAHMEMLEYLYPAATRNSIPRYRKAFHESFRVAKTGYHLARNLGDSLDSDQVEALLERWYKQGRTRFIVMTGFWIPVIEQYSERMKGKQLSVQLLRIDAGVSASYAVHGSTNHSYNNVWMFDLDHNQRLSRRLAVSPYEPLPFEERSNRYTIHGGGWGIGTYQDVIHPANEHGLPLNIIAYYLEDIPEEHGLHNYFLIDPSWNPWHVRADGEYDFPPFSQVSEQGDFSFAGNVSSPTYPQVFDLIRSSRAIISKPGGSTLVDSLDSATPLIMLEPFGSHEQANMELWESLGLGIRYERWREAQFSQDMLHDMHLNLLKIRSSARNVKDELLYRFELAII